ncbi:PilN domain-containing protein [Thermosediminibacter litoriperuensis]|uniref:Type IV pilus assembly protein PilN n=1 Tax=Thermosediminibacter litoriperuensis TaxID=291989 RepID=A0A5S5ANU8_9FIRM|nr:PilN domain-containing protein [Thermosediminibacter litoriperuensis]TYP53299.1 type IV pilus assembly protein PilN [Thermosediminibacter litoriperuensis]
MASINLLPQELRPSNKRIFLVRSKPVLALISVFMLIFSAYLFLLVHTWLLEKRLAEIEKEVAFYRQQEETVKEEEKKLNSFRQQKTELEKLVKGHQKWSELLMTLSDAIPPEVWLTGLEINREQEVKITGRSVSLEAAGRFLFALRNQPFLENVRLESARDVSGEEVLEFSITADVIKPDAPAGKEKQ